jgi:membrane fusion protein (multidrug efflux system)
MTPRPRPLRFLPRPPVPPMASPPIWLAVAIGLCGLLAGGCANSGGSVTGSGAPAEAGLDAGGAAETVCLRPESQPAVSPQAFKVEPQVWQATVRSQGGLIADELTVIGARMVGRIAEVSVEVGQQVTAGELLVRLDESELRLRVEQARAQLGRARVALGLPPVSESTDVVHCPDDADSIDVASTPEVMREQARLDEARGHLARLEPLVERNAVSRTELEAGIAAVAVAKATLAAAIQHVEEKVALVRVHRANLALAQENLDQASVRAPFDGVVQSRHGSSLGASVQFGDPLVTLVRTDPLRFRGTVPERQSLKLRVGQPVLVRLDSVAKPIRTTIARIAPLLDEMSRSLMFEADIPNPDGCLRSGLFAQADVVVDEQAEALVVPSTSVREFAGSEKVWRVEPSGHSRGVVVRTGRRSKDLVEIVSGLAPGDFVVQDAAGVDGLGFSH